MEGGQRLNAAQDILGEKERTTKRQNEDIVRLSENQKKLRDDINSTKDIGKRQKAESKKKQNDERNSCKSRKWRSKGNSKSSRWSWRIQGWLKKHVSSCQTATKTQIEKEDYSWWRRRSNNQPEKADQNHYRILQSYVSQKRRKRNTLDNTYKVRVPFTAEEIKTLINKLKKWKKSRHRQSKYGINQT